MQFINKIIAIITVIICIGLHVLSAPVDSDNTNTTITITTSKTRVRFTGEDTTILQSCLGLGVVILFIIGIFKYCKNSN